MEDITSSIQKKGNKNYFTILEISIGALITTSLALYILHIIFTKYCKRRNQTLYIEPKISIGLDDHILNTIPILFYSSKTCDLYSINKVDQCVICLGIFHKGDLIRWLPNCGHIFHVSCIDHWFHAHITCPICRALVHGPSKNRDVARARPVLPRTRSGGLMCHSNKLVLPIQGLGPCDLVKVGLKRSLSMDESCVVIDTREQSSSSSSSCSSSLLVDNSSCNHPTISKFDFLLSRFYGYREGHGGTLRSNNILPY
ncbi:unnamed protein product [Amaranthus hypochondriacus]